MLGRCALPLMCGLALNGALQQQKVDQAVQLQQQGTCAVEVCIAMSMCVGHKRGNTCHMLSADQC